MTIQTSQIQVGIACERLRATLAASVANAHLAQEVAQLARLLEADGGRGRRDLAEDGVGDGLATGGELDRLDVALRDALEVVLATDVLARRLAERFADLPARSQQLERR